MDWRRLERWATIATIALYAATVVSVTVLLGEILLPANSPAQRIFHGIANLFSRLGDIGGGAIIFVILLVIAGGGIVVLILRAIDKYQQNRERRARERAEWEAASHAEGHAAGRIAGHAEGHAAGHAEGHAEGRAEAHSEIRARLMERGINLDDLLPPDAAYPPQNENITASEILANLQVRRSE